MNEKIKMFESYLKEEEKAENTIMKYVHDIKEFYSWLATPHDNCRGRHFVVLQRRGELCEPGQNRRGEACEPEVTKEILLNYKDHLKKTLLKATTINSKISSLNAFFTYAKNESLKLKVLKCQKTIFGYKERELTQTEYRKLYSACKDNDKLRLIIETISCTGIRVSELKYITYESLKNGKAVIDNKGKIRTILLPRKLCIKLINYFHNNKYCRGRHFVVPHRMGELCEPVFTTRNGTPIDRKQIWQMLKKLAHKSGVPKEKVFPHNLRHLFAHEFYKSTHDIVKLASLLGHSSIETTRIYTKETEDECREALERISLVRD